MSFKVSKEARDDLRDIGRFTQHKWGKTQRRDYLNQLNRQFALLGSNPLLGRECDTIRKGYYRFECMSHVIFYKQDKDHVLISRILHKSRDVKALLSEESKT